MKKLLFILIGVLVLVSCNNENKAIKNQEAVKVSLANFEEEVADLTDMKIALEGTVTHVCKHGGKRFFLGEERIKVTASEEIGTFDTKLEGSDVYVEGILIEERVDEAYLVDWEDELETDAAVKEKEIAHTGEPGHDHAEESAEDPNADARERIANLRAQLEESGKEYLSFYEVKVLSVQEKK
jgi:hypothetical protein